MNQIKKKPTVEDERSNSYSKRKVVFKETERKAEYAKGVVTCNRRLANQNRNICIPAELCKFRREKIRSCSQYVKSSCDIKEKITKNMSSMNSPEESDPNTPFAFVNTSTHSGNVNLNVYSNRLNQPPNLSSDSDIEVKPPDKVIPKPTNSEKLNTVISFHHKFPGLSYPLVQSEKWIYSIVPTDSQAIKKIDYCEILNLKFVEANLEDNPCRDPR